MTSQAQCLRLRGRRELSRPAAARHRRFPAHDRAALRRPREVDPRARRGDEGRQAHPARDADERRRRRSGDRRDLHDRHARLRAAAAEAARRHREGAGRGRRARRRSSATPAPTIIRGRCRRPSPTRRSTRSRSRRWRARWSSEFESYVKLNKKISPEVVAAVGQIDDYAKLADTVASHLAVKIADKQAILEMPLGRQAPREVPGADGERDLGPAGREAHPHARQAPDGEDAARVLPQRADEGDPEGARRRGRQGRPRRARGAHQGRPSSPRRPATRRRPS